MRAELVGDRDPDLARRDVLHAAAVEADGQAPQLADLTTGGERLSDLQQREAEIGVQLQSPARRLQLLLVLLDAMEVVGQHRPVREPAAHGPTLGIERLERLDRLARALRELRREGE